mgnify:CR=1 FL=1
MSVHRRVIGMEVAPIAHVAAPVRPTVAVEALLPRPSRRHPNPIVRPNDGGRIEHEEQRVLAPTAPVRKHAVLAIIVRDPLEALLGVIPERRMRLVQRIQVAQPLHKARVQWLIGKPPFKLEGVIPLVRLA